MSTKTTFKRIALVAVAALGLSVVAVAPSTAVVNSDTLTAASATSAVTIGNATTNVVTSTFLAGESADFVTNTVVLTSAPAGNSALPQFVTGTETIGITPTNNVVTATRTNSEQALGLNNNQAYQNHAVVAGAVSSAATVTLTPVVAGTYVVTITQTGGVATRSVTWTITAAARTPVTGATSTSTIVAAAAPNGYGVEATGVSAPRTVVAPTWAARVDVVLQNSLTANTAQLADVTALTASISGPGTLSWNAVSPNYGRAVTMSAAALSSSLYVYADGNAGVSTITIAMGTTIISTETITFFGAPASIVSTVVNPIVATTGGSTSATNAITAVVKDALGNPVAGASLFATSDALTVVNNSYTAANAATDASGKTSFTLTPAALGTANITVGTGSSAAAVSPVNAAPVAVRSGSTTVAGIKFSLDSTDYTPGQAAVLTVSFTDAAGLPVANHSTLNTLMSSNILSSIALTGAALPAVSGQSLAITNNAGTVTLPINMPITSGEVTISAGTLIGGVAGTASVKASVTNAEIAAAQDAAAEATDAANAATDAANAAAEAADAATAAAQDAADAVAALSTEVAAMITALKKQITALTNLVIKIQKKVRA